MKIDIHAHFYPKRYIDTVQHLTEGDNTPWAQGVRKMLTAKIAPNRRMTDINAHIDDMDQAGVDMEVLSLSMPHVYFDDKRVAVELAKITNDEIAAICAKYPDRFKGFAVVPLPHTDAALAELDRAANTLDLHGVTLGANISGRPLDQDSFLPLYEEINRQQLTIFLHPMIPPAQEELADYDMSAAIGFLFDSTIAALRLAYRGVFAANPELTCIIPHLGAVLPYAWDRIATSYQTRPEAQTYIPQPPTEYLSRLYYDSVNFHLPAWHCLLETVGAEQIVYGSDYPFALGSKERAIACIEALDVTPEQRELIYCGNALQLLR